MLENLQRTSTAHVGLQPNSQVRCSEIPEFEQHLMVSGMSTVIDVTPVGSSCFKSMHSSIFIYIYMPSLFRLVRK